MKVVTQLLAMMFRRFRIREPEPPAELPDAGVASPSLPSACHPASFNEMELLQRRDDLMTPSELAFFSVLEPIAGSCCHVSSKVRISDLFDVRLACGRKSMPKGICNEHIDFVLTDYETSRIICAIELVDASHDLRDHDERDRFLDALFAENELPLLRVPGEWTYHPKVLRAELLKAGLMLSDVA